MSLGCDSGKENQHEEYELDAEEHGQEEEALSYTLYSADYELFVEFPPLVVGQINSFAAHITSLSDYKPLTQGKLTVSLFKDKKGISNKVESPASPGIFRPVLQPEEPGIFRLLFELVNSIDTTSFEINEIEVYASHENVNPQHEAEGNEIIFLKEQAWKTDFAINFCRRKNFKEVINTSGQILPANGDETTLVASYSGIVKMSKTLMTGKEVKKGETLITLSGKGLASDNFSVHYTELKTNYEKEKANYERLQQLVDEKIVSEKEFIEAKTSYEQARVAFENVSDSGDGSISQVKATLTGFVKDVKVTDGQFVDAGTPLVIIAQNKRLIIRADVSQNHWDCLPDIEEANFITPYNSKLYNTNELNGRLVSYSRNAINSAWSTPLFFEVSNTGSLIPGSFIEVFLLSKPKPDVIAIPMSALIEEQGHFYVIVQLSGESYEKRKVITGINNGIEVEIVKGLSEGEIIVTLGAYEVKLASMSSTLPAHRHDH
jgi:RND family efflux transporter MFP subunit